MITSNRFVGRRDELEVFEKSFDRLSDGKGCFVLVSGRAGIGKTALTQECAIMAEHRDAICVTASFPPHAERTPYWGWSTILRQLADRMCSDSAVELARALQNSDELPPQSSQTLVHERLCAVLTKLSENSQLAIVLEDIQNADFASLRILERLVAEISRIKVILVATLRSSDVSSTVASGSGTVPFALTAAAQRVNLRGMDQLECAQLCREVTGWTPDADLIRRLHLQTEGNPLFLKQILIALIEEGYIQDGAANLPDRLAVPAGITDMIGSRLDRIGQECRLVLEQASILGHSWQLAVLKNLAPDFDPRVLDEAERAGLIRPVNLPLGQWLFTHALIREVLYDSIPPFRRLHAHAAAMIAIEALSSADDPKSISALAYHSFEGQVFAGTNRAIELARKAGRYAVSVAAYQDGAAHFRIALECFEVPGIDEPDEKIETALELAKAQRLAGENLNSIKTCRRALEWARFRSDWPRFARAALSYEAARWQPGLPSEEVIDFLKLALANSNEISDDDVVRLRYSLARALQGHDEVEKAVEHGRRAIAEARKIGDKELLCDAIDQGTSAYCTMPGTWDERLVLVAEQVQIAQEIGDDHRLANAMVNHGICLAVKGRFGELRAASGRLAQLAAALAEPHHQYVSAQRATLFAMLDGDFLRASSSASSALEIGRRIAGANVSGLYGIQIFLINRDRGVLGALASLVEAIEEKAGANLWQPGQAFLLAELGEFARASAVLDLLVEEGFDNLPSDDMRSLSLAFMAEVVWLTRDPKHARQLHKLLIAQSGETITVGPGPICFGPVDRSLGLLQACMQNYDVARARLEDAIDQVRGWPSRPLLLRTACDLCKVLILDGTPSAIKRASELHAEFAPDAKDAGMAEVARRYETIDSELRRLTSTRGYHQLTAREVEVLRELSHGASNAAISCNLGISHATVATHVRNILSKTESKNRTAAAAFARQAGLVGDHDLS